eukprot:1176003-Prorocentrum_minimum.AAC.1
MVHSNFADMAESSTGGGGGVSRPYGTFVAARRGDGCRGYGVDVRGYGVDVRGYVVDVRGYGDKTALALAFLTASIRRRKSCRITSETLFA